MGMGPGFGQRPDERCTRCGRAITPDASFCPGCGVPILRASPPSLTVPTAPPGQSLTSEARPRARTPLAKILFAVILVVAVVGVGLYLLSPDFRGSIQNAVTPSCTVGLNGAAVSVSVQGADAQAQCNSFLTRTTDGGAWYVYSGGQQPAGASICQVNYHGDLITVRDQGALDLYGSSICSGLIDQANGVVPGAATTQAFLAPTQDPAQAYAQASASAAAQARSNITSAASAAQSDIDGLASSEADLSGDVATIPKDLTSMATDVATTLKDRDAVLSEASDGTTDSGTVCSDAASVASDEATVESDLATINSDGATLDSDIYSIQNGISDLQQHRDQLAAARASLPSYADGGPSAADIDAALTKANAAIDAAQQAFSGDLKTAQGYVSTATGYAAKAQQACDAMP
jgi:zinc-ribbon domain